MLINLLKSKTLKLTLTTLLLLTSPAQVYPQSCRSINPVVILNGEKYTRLECSLTKSREIEFIDSNDKNFKGKDNERETIEKLVETAEVAEIIESRPKLKIGSKQISLEELNSLTVSIQSKVIELSAKFPSLISTLMNLSNQGLSSLTYQDIVSSINQNSQKRTYLDKASELFQKIETKTQKNLSIAQKYNGRLLRKELSYEDAATYFSNLLYLMLHIDANLQFFKEAFIHEINQVFWEGLNLSTEFILSNPKGDPLINYQANLVEKEKEAEAFLKKYKRKIKFSYYEQVETTSPRIPLRIFIEGICNDDLETTLMSFSPKYLILTKRNSSDYKQKLKKYFQRAYTITPRACKEMGQPFYIYNLDNLAKKISYLYINNPLISLNPSIFILYNGNGKFEILEWRDNPSNEEEYLILSEIFKNKSKINSFLSQ